MLAYPQPIEDEDIEILKKVQGFLGNRLGIGDVGEVAEAIPGDRQASVKHRNRDNLLAQGFEWSSHLVQMQIRFPSVEGERIDERIGEAVSKHSSSGGVGVHGEMLLLQLVKSPQVVEATRVIGMGVRHQDSIDVRESICERLSA